MIAGRLIIYFVRMLLFFFFILMKVICVEHLSSRETKTHVVSEWGSDEELLLVQDGAPPQFVPYVRERIGNHFHVCRIGRRGQTKWPPYDVCLRLGQGRIYISKQKHTHGEMEQQISVMFATVLPDLRKIAGFVPSRLQVCVECWGLC